MKETIMHELLHTIPGCMNHGKEWKDCAEHVNRLLGYNITTKTNLQSVVDRDRALAYYKYAFECEGCKSLTGRFKKSKIVTHTHFYSCGKCGGTFRRIK